MDIEMLFESTEGAGDALAGAPVADRLKGKRREVYHVWSHAYGVSGPFDDRVHIESPVVLSEARQLILMVCKIPASIRPLCMHPTQPRYNNPRPCPAVDLVGRLEYKVSRLHALPPQ